MKKNIKSVHRPIRKRLTVPQSKRRNKKILRKRRAVKTVGVSSRTIYDDLGYEDKHHTLDLNPEQYPDKDPSINEENKNEI
tara:strand:+ start:4617 stop:4859 length:243 start_codon:yes stop_codon:yes gene_type:complete